MEIRNRERFEAELVRAAFFSLQRLLVSFHFIVRNDSHYFCAALRLDSEEVTRVASIQEFVARIEEAPFDLDLVNSGANGVDAFDCVLPVDRLYLVVTTE